jgi:hypothetical protein
MQKMDTEMNSFKRILRLIAKIIYGITAACIWSVLFLVVKPTSFFDSIVLGVLMIALFFLYFKLFGLFEEENETDRKTNRRKKSGNRSSDLSWGYWDGDNGCDSTSDSGCGSSGDGGGD